MNVRQHIKETIKLSIPIATGQFGLVMMGVVDSLFVGHIGSAPLAASSLVNGIFFLIIVLGFGVCMAATPLISIAKGSGKPEECGRILNHSLVVNSVFAILLTAGAFSCSFFLPYLNQPKEVVREAIPYLHVLSISALPLIIFQSYKQFLEGLSIPNPPMVVSILANFSNAFLNWVFVFGNLGMPALGLTGSGLSTTVSRILMAAALMLFAFKYKKVEIYKPRFKLPTIDFGLIKKIIGIGMPSGFQYFLEVAAFTFAAVMIGWLGVTQLAAHQIAMNMASLTYMVILGISSAGTIRVGDAVGQKNILQIRRAGFTSIALAASVMFCFGVCIILFRNFFSTLYISDKAVVQTASNLLIVAALFQIFDGLQCTGIGVLRGLTDTKIPMLIGFASYWLIGTPVALLMGFYFKLGAVGVWIGLLFGLASLGITLLFRFNIKTKDILKD